MVRVSSLCTEVNLSPAQFIFEALTMFPGIKLPVQPSIDSTDHTTFTFWISYGFKLMSSAIKSVPRQDSGFSD